MKNNKPTTLIILVSILVLLFSPLVACGTQTRDSTDISETEAPGVAVAIDISAERLALKPGECTLIEWHVQGGFGVDLNGETVDFTGQESVCPETTTTYQISVDAGDKLEQADLEIIVETSDDAKPVETSEPSSTDIVSTDSSSYEVTVQKDIVYGTYTADGQSHNLLLDLYLPKDSTAQPVPVIVYIHGGGWFEGSRDICPGNTFASRGYAVACVEYRLARMDKCTTDYIFPVQLYDNKSAVRWLRLNSSTYGLDSNKIAAMGDSSGGHLAALLGTSYGVSELEGDQNTGVSDQVQAVVDWYGPVDIINGPSVFSDDPCTTPLNTLNQTYGGESTPYFYWTLAWGLFLGGSLDDQQVLSRAAEATPLTYVDPSDPPFLILHGEDDGMVPISQSEMLADALKAAGVEVTFLKIANASHSYGSPDDEVSDDFLTPTLQFLDKHLGK
jgi:acetyl esterase/lipase